MKTTILFKDDHFVPLNAARRSKRTGANDNFRSLEFEMEGQERDWRTLCLIASVVCGFAALIFMPLW